jgi:hypothetical protein
VETFWIVGLQINALRSHPSLNHEISAKENLEGYEQSAGMS